MMPKKGSFRCRDCGYCCTLIVELSDEDIERIRKEGYDESEFVEQGRSGKNRIRLRNYYCYFLGLSKGETFCRIYNARPRVCRDYPFFGKNTALCYPPRLFDDDAFGKKIPKK